MGVIVKLAHDVDIGGILRLLENAIFSLQASSKTSGFVVGGSSLHNLSAMFRSWIFAIETSVHG